MKWFKKWSHELPESQHSNTAKRRKSLSKSEVKSEAKTIAETESNKENSLIKEILRESKHWIHETSLSLVPQNSIEVLDPDEFFGDPDHIRNYKEEALFLDMMSEWVIVENPNHNANFFSGDFDHFDERLIHDESEFIIEEEDHLDHNPEMRSKTSLIQENQEKDDAEKLRSKKQKAKNKKKSSKSRRSLYDLLFSDSIEMGIPVPKSRHDLNSKRSISCCDINTLRTSHNFETTTRTTTTMTRTTQSTQDCETKSNPEKTEYLAKISSTHSLVCDLQMQKQNLATARSSDLERFSPRIWPYQCDQYDIKEFFRLDHLGNIRLSISHVKEHKGWGLVVAHNKSLYKRYSKSCKCVDECFLYNEDSSEAIHKFLNFFWSLLICHPRNKVNLYGSGPGDSLRNYTLQLAQDQNSTFARNIENFISCTKESREAVPQIVMRNMRQFMNGIKNYLVKHGEAKFHQEVELARARLKADEFLNLDAILETVMHQLVVLPLKEHLYGMFVDYYTRSEDIQLLAQNVKYACGRNAADFGIRPEVTPPSSSSLIVISNLLLRLQEAELPLEKLDLFLNVITSIFNATGCPRGQQLGADDFLPILVYVVAKCGFVGAEIEAEYMWGLLQPTLLIGEPGYYLTSLCSAVHALKRFMSSENESGTVSLDWRSSSMPACSSVLRVIIPDECNGSLQTRTLPVRPHTTTREVCRIIAHKARITNPQDYALFKLVDGEETLLNDAECPQDVRFTAKGKHCMLAYKRIDAKIAWPTTTQPSHH